MDSSPPRTLPIWADRSRRVAGTGALVVGWLVFIGLLIRASDHFFGTAIKHSWVFSVLKSVALVAICIALVAGAVRLVGEGVAGYRTRNR